MTSPPPFYLNKSMENKKEKIIRTKTWTVEVHEYEDGSYGIVRTNDGFAAHELLGICEFTREDIIEQMSGRIQPDIVERKVVK